MDFGRTPIAETGKQGRTGDYGKILSVQSSVFKALLGWFCTLQEYLNNSDRTQAEARTRSPPQRLQKAFIRQC